jgi:hypothetical protein
MNARGRYSEGDSMPNVYGWWVGRAVILQVAVDEFTVPLRGVIVGESEATLRFLVGEDLDLDIHKSMILAVEQENGGGFLVN